MTRKCSPTTLLQIILFFGVTFIQTYAFECGFYRIESVATGRHVEAPQEGLPLFVGLNLSMAPAHGTSEKDYTIWYIEKRSGRQYPMRLHYMIQNNATKMYARLYQETSDLTILVAEKEPTFFDLAMIENHEWSIKLSDSSSVMNSLWTVLDVYHQVILEQEMTTKKGIPKAAQRFRFHAV